MNKIKYIAAALVAVAGLGLQQAKADTISFDLGAGNAAISGFPGPYAHVVVDRTDATHATITFTSLTNSGRIYLMGGAQAVDVNVNATSWTIGSFAATKPAAGFSSVIGNLSNGGANNADGFGSFNQTVDNFDGFTHSWSSISFVLTNTSGTWATASAVLTANASGFLAAAHIFVTTSPANASNGVLATGFARNGGSTPGVPDGGTTAMLLGAALGALGMARRFLKI
jgi:protein with PEP-CTERM/exosortase system signal